MNAIASYFIAIPILTGGLVAWPVSRKFMRPDDRRLPILKTIFFAQIILAGGGYCLVGYCFLAGMGDCLHALVYPYGFSVLTLIGSIGALVIIRK